jgi:DNA repair protein RadC
MATYDHDGQLRLSFTSALRRRSSRLTAARVRVELVRDADPPGEPVVIRGAGDVYAFLKDEVATWDRERFLTLILDNKRLIGVEEVSVGSLTASIVHPREVFKAILLSNGAAFLACHNHPAGIATPSKEDIEITRRLKEGAELLGVRFLDHIIIGRGVFVSFVDDGYW